jgi:hypothetical protein
MCVHQTYATLTNTATRSEDRRDRDVACSGKESCLVSGRRFHPLDKTVNPGDADPDDVANPDEDPAVLHTEDTCVCKNITNNTLTQITEDPAAHANVKTGHRLYYIYN